MRRHVLVVLSIVLSSAFCQRANSQTNAEKKTAGATISGKVTIKGKPARGLVVGVRLSQSDPSTQTFQAKTDDDGIYHVTGVPVGSFVVAPVAPALVISEVNESWGRSLVVNEGDTIEGINFDLLRGGVITGKVTDDDGNPIIAQTVSLLRVDSGGSSGPYGPGMFETDDRGIYRIFGVAPGHYKVSVSDNHFGSGTVRSRSLPATYHPNTTDSTKAAIIEVGEGTEATQIDITVSRAIEGFTVSGQVIDQATSNPISNARIYLTRITVIDASTTSGIGGATDVRSNGSGAFRLDNLSPGKYTISIEPPADASLIVEPVNFDLLDADVSGLVIKTSNGASVSGTVVLEGGSTDVGGRPPKLWVYAHVKDEGGGFSSTRPAETKPDGSFRAGGLLPGTVSFSGGTFTQFGDAKRLTISRIERDGVAQPNAITIQGTEQIRGITVVLSYSSGSLRGLVRVLNGALAAPGHLFAVLKAPNDPNEHSTQVDARGRFLIENVGPGTYELTVHYYDNAPRKFAEAKQTVKVNAGETADVVITLDLSGLSKP
jgi:carboxypeptidase family protein/polysaccharide lyase family 4-like protein